MPLRRDAQAISAYRAMLNELGIDVHALSDDAILADLQRAAQSWSQLASRRRRATARIRARITHACTSATAITRRHRRR